MKQTDKLNGLSPRGLIKFCHGELTEKPASRRQHHKGSSETVSTVPIPGKLYFSLHSGTLPGVQGAPAASISFTSLAKSTSTRV
jgi:hypothetical protein